MFVIRRLQELARKKRIPLYAYLINFTKAYDCVDRTLPWTVLSRFGVPQNTISTIRQFYDGMQACVRLDDEVCSWWFAVNQNFRQGCMLAPLLFDIVFAAVINVAYSRFKAEKAIMDALIWCTLRGKQGRGAGGGGRGAGENNRRRVSTGEAALGHALR